MRIGFLENHLTERGTSKAIFHYAEECEKLGHVCIIFTRDFTLRGEPFTSVYKLFMDRFLVVFIQDSTKLIDDAALANKIDRMYVQKSGEKDNYVTTVCPCMVHCVFNSKHPHGSVYATISEDINQRHGTKFPVVPYMVKISSTEENLREKLGIPQNSVVFGRHGGKDSFDVQFVKEAVSQFVRETDCHFVFLNTNRFDTHERIHYLECSTDQDDIKKFINTCDVMLHARLRGETFGLACAEFAMAKKPVLTWANSHESAHLEVLGDAAILYKDKSHLLQLLRSKDWTRDFSAVERYSSEKVMDIFIKTFL